MLVTFLSFPPAYQSCLTIVSKISFVEMGKKCGKFYLVCKKIAYYGPTRKLILIRFLAHRSRRLIGELIGYSWSGVRLSSVRPPTMLKDLLLQNRLANQSQILCGASLGRGNESLFAPSWSHDQDGRHAHIW